jgi:hypothetical protein
MSDINMKKYAIGALLIGLSSTALVTNNLGLNGISNNPLLGAN